MAHFWLLHRAKNRGVGLDIAVSVIDKFTVNKRILQDAQLKALAEKVIALAQENEDYEEVDNEINKRVYELYGISTEEALIMHEYIKERVKNG